MPRVSFAVISRETLEKVDKIEDNGFVCVRYVDTGKMDVAFQYGPKFTVKAGEYCIYPRKSKSQTVIHKNTTTTLFSFFIDEGEDKLINSSEVLFEKSDNYKYVDIESLFILQTGKITPSDRAYSELKQLVHRYDAIGEYTNANVSMHAWNFLLWLANAQINDIKGNKEEKKNSVEKYCDRIDEYIEKNYMMPITMTTIADLLVLHENYISRIYKQTRGLTVVEHLRNVRIEKAKELLLQNKYTIAQVAKAVGFLNVKYFIAVFKKVESVSPGKYYRNLFERRLYSYDKPEYLDYSNDEIL